MLEEIFKQFFYILILMGRAALLLFAPLVIVLFSCLWVASKCFRIKWSELAPSSYERRFIYIGTAASCLTYLIMALK